MELGLEHLAPYLPHKLYVKVFDEKPIVMIASGSSSSNWIGIGAVVKWSENCKPLLHPLSRLTEEIGVNGDRFVPEYKLWEASENKDFIIKLSPSGSIHNETPYWVFQKLLEWHIDVFGLIPKGLAEAIKTEKA